MFRFCFYFLFFIFFILDPFENERAKNVIAYPDNNYLILILSNNILAFDISFYIRGKLSKIFIILGRGIDADIFVKGFSIAKI